MKTFSQWFGTTPEITPERVAKRNELGFWSDNPNDPQWLKHNKTSITAKYNNAVVPIEYVENIPGQHGEHKNVIPEKYEHWKEILKNDPEVLYKNPIQVNVFHNGKSKINEGNHRMRAAKDLGIKTIAVSVHYFGGSETNPNSFDPASL